MPTMTDVRRRLRMFVEESRCSGVSATHIAGAIGISRANLYFLMDPKSTQLATRRVAIAIERVTGIPRTDWSPLYVDDDDSSSNAA